MSVKSGSCYLPESYGEMKPFFIHILVIIVFYINWHFVHFIFTEVDDFLNPFHWIRAHFRESLAAITNACSTTTWRSLFGFPPRQSFHLYSFAIVLSLSIFQWIMSEVSSSRDNRPLHAQSHSLLGFRHVLALTLFCGLPPLPFATIPFLNLFIDLFYSSDSRLVYSLLLSQSIHWKGSLSSNNSNLTIRDDMVSPGIFTVLNVEKI